MPQLIQSYLPPGAYSTILLNPTVATSVGLPVVGIVSQGLQGPFSAQLFANISDLTSMYGTASSYNPISLAGQFAFLNGAPRVLCINVQPDNSTPATLTFPITSLPTSAYIPAPPSALDAVTGQQVNPTGGIAGTFYVQDFNPNIPNPVYAGSATQESTAFALLGPTSLLQYVQLLGGTQIPLSNTPMSQVTVAAPSLSTPPISSTGQPIVSQSRWNQFINATTLMNAFLGGYQTPVQAQIVLPDNSQTAFAPLPGYRNMFASVGLTLNGIQINSINDAYNYACNFGGQLMIQALETGSQHQIIVGLFDSNTANANSTNRQGFGIPAINNGAANNPFFTLPFGSNGVVTNNSYINAINNQLGTQRVDVVICTNTDYGLLPTIQNHVYTNSLTQFRNERIAMVSGPISEPISQTTNNLNTIQGAAGSERMVYIWPTVYFYFDPVQNKNVALNGTYMAAACAGIVTSNDASEPLTHKLVGGFVDVGVKAGYSVLNSIAAQGISVIENNPLYGIRVRHGLTCNTSFVETQEISVVRQLDYVAQTLRTVLESNFIATKITQNTPAAILATATTTLQSLEDGNIIYGFQNVAARINPNNPTQIDVSCSVRPAYPCNYINITITVSSSLAGFQNATGTSIGSSVFPTNVFNFN